MQDVLESLVGRTITEVAETESRYIILTLDDGRRVQFEGGGYDGLWDDVYAVLLPEGDAA